MRTPKERILLVCAFAVLVLASVSAKAVTEEWVARYDPNGGNDLARDIAVDDIGNVYVTGESRASAESRYATVKYNTNGVQLWARRYNSPTAGAVDIARAIAIDSNGVYVTGEGAGDCVTIKYSVGGVQQWVARYNGAGNGADVAYDITVDAAGDVYVTGESYRGAPSYKDYVTIKYDGATGAQLWEAWYDRAGLGDSAYAITVDANYVYVTGCAETSSATSYIDYTTIKYPAGSNVPSWIAVYDGPLVGWDIDVARDIVVDDIGNVYVTGESDGNTTSCDYATVKYAPSGVQLWVARYDCFMPGYGSGYDYATSLVLDSERNVYVTGGSYDPRGFDFNEPPALPYEDIATIKYDTNGNEVWVDRYDWYGHHDVGHDIAVDNKGGVYVTGESLSRVALSYQYDYVTLRYDSSNGNELWVARYNGPGKRDDNAMAIGLDAARNVYVTGGSYQDALGSNRDYATIKYSQDFRQASKWTQLPDESPTGMDIRCDRNDGIMRTLADDFPCITTGRITDVHFWGSWRGDPSEKGTIEKIHLSIHSDIPVDDPCNTYGYSMPGDSLWERDFLAGDFNETLYRDFSDYNNYPYHEWFYDPYSGNEEPNGDQQIWQYDIYIDPCDAFTQQGDPCNPIVYWLDIFVELDVNSQEAEFGWKTTKKNWNDDAVRSYTDDPNWLDLRYPSAHPYASNSVDLAFAITTDANEPNEPPFDKPLEPHTKWSQPPIEIDPTSPIPTYCGWDEASHNVVDPPTPLRKVVADDFRCIGSMPITSIHWWGSYFDWEQGPGLPPVLPEKWWIGFWSNVPANAPPYELPYSYPDVLLHSITIDANRVTIEEVGSDEYYGYYPYDICYQYNVDLGPNEVFWQDDFNDMTEDNIYWISIVAEYNDVAVPYNPWGWKTRQWHWMDDAVTFILDFEPAAGFAMDPYAVSPLIDPVWGESVDVSFELDTDPNYIKWEQLYTGIRDWPHYEDELSIGTGAGPIINRLVADDWLCERKTPVTAVVWWGSYIGYHYEACQGLPTAPPIKPDYFLLNVWTDVPADPNVGGSYSHPDEKIWEYRAYDYDEVLVGYDKHPEHEPPYRVEPVFRYSVRLPKDAWFMQQDVNGVYWLSVVAVYEVNTPNYSWGWTNHEHVFNDDAVAGTLVGGDEWTWEELYDQTDASEDMSFILFTEPDCIDRTATEYSDWIAWNRPDCWCYQRQCRGDADGGRQLIFWVYSNDLNILKSAYAKPNAIMPPGGICADFDHAKQLIFRVYSGDLAILKTYYAKPPGSVPICDQPPIYTGPYNFWTN